MHARPGTCTSTHTPLHMHRLLLHESYVLLIITNKIRTQAHAHVHTCTNMCTCGKVHMCMHVCTLTCKHTGTNRGTHVHACIHQHTHTQAYVCTCAHASVHVPGTCTTVHRHALLLHKSYVFLIITFLFLFFHFHVSLSLLASIPFLLPSFYVFLPSLSSEQLSIFPSHPSTFVSLLWKWVILSSIKKNWEK